MLTEPLKYLLKAMGMARSTYCFEIGRTDGVAEKNADLSCEIGRFLSIITADMASEESIVSC